MPKKSDVSTKLTNPTPNEIRRIQKQSLTDERELALESYRAERKKLKSIQQQTLQLYHRLKAADMASIIAPYPTLGEASKRAAGAYFTPALFSDRTRKVVRVMQRLP